MAMGFGSRARSIPIRYEKRVRTDGGSTDPDRPRTRDDCQGGYRPCPYVSCRHHLYLEVSEQSGSIKLLFPDKEPWELEHSCSLDLADNGDRTLENVGTVLNITRERARQIEARGLIKLRRSRVEL